MADTQWWIVLTAQSTSGGTESGFMVVSGTETEIKNKYGSSARGPFKTKADAEQAVKGDVGSGPGNIAVGSTPQFKNPLDSLQEVGHFVGVLVTDITDVAMWRSIGWILLGFLMFVGGIFLWLKDKGMVPNVVPIPV